MMYDHLQKWGPRREEVKFFLRHEDSPTESAEQGMYSFILGLLLYHGYNFYVPQLLSV